MLPLFFAVLANVVGLGVIVPLLPFYAEGAGASAQQIAWLFAVFSGAQFLTAPLWGRLSDRIGRKPVIVTSFVGTAVGYVWLAYADGLTGIFLARAFAGMMNGWLATSQAYVADVTTPEGRAKGMGTLGAAFGIAFIIGPALGGYLVGGGTPDFELPILIAAGSSALALVTALFALREPERHGTSAAAESLRIAGIARAAPILAVMIGLNFGIFFVFAGMESTFAVWCGQALAMGPRDVGYYLSFAGVVGVVVQGWLVGKLAPRVGEGWLVAAGLLALAAALALLPTSTSPPMLLTPIALLSLGFGLATPALVSLVSRTASEDIRGGALGVSQSAQSLGRILGPTWAGFAFVNFGRDWPFFSGALILLPLVAVAAAMTRRLRAQSGNT
jgi:DHA1 family tetracycline resistance protein-like MFS transporter